MAPDEHQDMLLRPVSVEARRLEGTRKGRGGRRWPPDTPVKSYQIPMKSCENSGKWM